MRHDLMRTVCLGAVLALATACATSPTSSGDADAARGTSAVMSNKGLANLNLAHNYMAAGKLDFALDRANRALRSDPGSGDVQVVLGMIRERLGDEDRAAEHYARAARLSPDSGHVLNVYGVWLCQKDQNAEADAMFQRAVKDPFFKTKENAYFNAAKCAMKVGQADKAASYLRQGLEFAPTNTTLLVQMAELQLQRGDFMSARAFFQRSEAQGTPNADLYELGARIEDAAGDRLAAARYRQLAKDRNAESSPPATEGSRQP
jgi:type IV pilus assembly protein PilF